MRWRIPLVVVLALFVAVSCDQQPVGPQADQVTEAPAPLFSGQRTEVPFSFQFDDIDPCTGLLQTITVTGTQFIQGAVVHEQKTITTSAGYEGRGTNIFPANGQVDGTFILNDILRNASTGHVMKAHLVVVLEHGTPRVEIFGAPRCVHN